MEEFGTVLFPEYFWCERNLVYVQFSVFAGLKLWCVAACVAVLVAPCV